MPRKGQIQFGRPWTAEEDAVLRELYPHEPSKAIAAALGRSLSSVYVRAQCIGVQKSDEYVATTRWRAGHVPASMGRPFEPGHRAWNKGTSYRNGSDTMRARYAAGYRPHTEKPIGSLRLRTTRGLTYVERKFSMVGTNQSQRWRAVHRLVWEAEHGPTPRGHVVVFRPGMHTVVAQEITLDRLELVTHAQLLERNSVLRYPPELRTAMRRRARLERAIREVARATA